LDVASKEFFPPPQMVGGSLTHALMLRIGENSGRNFSTLIRELSERTQLEIREDLESLDGVGVVL